MCAHAAKTAGVRVESGKQVPRRSAREASLVRSKLGDLVFYSQLLPFQFVNAQVIAGGVFKLGGDRRL